jgi:hypothetical protein
VAEGVAGNTGPAGLPATLLSALIQRGEVAAVDLINHTLTAIERLDPLLHAFCTLVPEQALRQAAEIDRRHAAGGVLGPLAGVPVAVKDLICTRGIRTTFGSPLYAGYVPTENDIVVERLQNADAIVIGKTNTSEFGYGPVGHNRLFATTRNPWNPALTPGGLLIAPIWDLPALIVKCVISCSVPCSALQTIWALSSKRPIQDLQTSIPRFRPLLPWTAIVPG